MKSWDDEGLQLNHLLPAASHLCKQQCCSFIEKYFHFKYFSIYIKFNHLTKRALGGTAWQRASFLGCDTIPARSPGGMMQPPSPPSGDAHQCVPVHVCVSVPVLTPVAGRGDLLLVQHCPQSHSVLRSSCPLTASPAMAAATPVPSCSLSSCDASSPSPRNPHLAPERAGVSQRAGNCCLPEIIWHL